MKKLVRSLFQEGQAELGHIFKDGYIPVTDKRSSRGFSPGTTKHGNTPGRTYAGDPGFHHLLLINRTTALRSLIARVCPNGSPANRCIRRDTGNTGKALNIG